MGQLFPTCVSYPVYAHQWGKSCDCSSLLLFCFCFAFASVCCRPGLGEGRVKRKIPWFFSLAPVLFSIADVEKDIWEMESIISWGLFIPLLLISQKPQFLDFQGKNFKILFSREYPPRWRRGAVKKWFTFFHCPFCIHQFSQNWPNDSPLPLCHFERCCMWLWMIMLFVLLRIWIQESPTPMRLVLLWNEISPLRSATVEMTVRRNRKSFEMRL